MAHSYSHLFGFQTIGLRFFTVCGPWGRPDMAYFLFTRSILNNEKIDVFNHGNLFRDYTYIDDVTEVMNKILLDRENLVRNYNIYNVGNNKTVKLLDFISAIEHCLETKANLNFLDMQPGDVQKHGRM